MTGDHEHDWLFTGNIHWHDGHTAMEEICRECKQRSYNSYEIPVTILVSADTYYPPRRER